jgi:hypothetical protein
LSYIAKGKDEGGRMADEPASASSLIPHPSSFDLVEPGGIEPPRPACKAGIIAVRSWPRKKVSSFEYKVSS